MSRGYWVRGYPYTNANKTTCKEQPVIHRFDTREEADFFKSQIAKGEILLWGEMERRYQGYNSERTDGDAQMPVL